MEPINNSVSSFLSTVLDSIKEVTPFNPDDPCWKNRVGAYEIMVRERELANLDECLELYSQTVDPIERDRLLTCADNILVDLISQGLLSNS